MNWTESTLLTVLIYVLFLLFKTRRKQKKASNKPPPDLDLDQLQAVYSKTVRIIRDDELFLQKNLKVSDISGLVKENEKIVSRAINHFSKGNFNHLINTFRIDKAVEMISSGNYEHYTIEAIADECGFSNKVSFYNAFKVHQGMSPKEFWALKQSKTQ